MGMTPRHWWHLIDDRSEWDRNLVRLGICDGYPPGQQESGLRIEIVREYKPKPEPKQWIDRVYAI